MPIQYVRDDARKRIRVTLLGSITVPELIEVAERQAAEGTWSYGILYDTRPQTNPDSAGNATPALDNVRELTKVHGPRGPVAIVARSAGIVANAQMFTVWSADVLVMEVFWDVGEAERWLDERLR
jgi:hypothetical protein